MDRLEKKAVVIGAGFSGLSAAATLAAAGYQVHVLEKHARVGGRARVLHQDGFHFDMGPSWYWMPEIAESFFRRFGHTTSDFFRLRRLDPSYQVIFSKTDVLEIPADFGKLKEVFELREKGSGARLEQFLSEARFKYETGMGRFVTKPGLSWREYAHWNILKASFRLNLFRSFSAHIRKYFRSPELLRLLEFPVLFLGAMPDKIPALYSMMNYADMKLGTWYPMGGFGQVAEAMARVAENQGATFQMNSSVESISVDDGMVKRVILADGREIRADLLVGSADYNHIDQHLLPREYRRYSASYWENRTMAPSCLLYYVGVRKKLPRLRHHNLFFERDFSDHARQIYVEPAWPRDPLYYVCCPSKTDPAVAPEGMENLFVLIPVAPGLADTPEIRTRYFNETMQRLEAFCGIRFLEDVVSCTSYAHADFVADYNAFKGNAYGLANTLGQTAVRKPSIISKKVRNLFYTGQLTVPGPGVPPAIISGQLVADYIVKNKC